MRTTWTRWGRPPRLLCVALMLCALASPTAMAQTQTTVRPIDNTIEVGVGQTAAINFLVENVEGLYGFEMHLRFDPAFIEVVDSYPDQPGVQVRPGNFLSVDLVVQNTVDNEFGLVDYAMTQLNPTEAKTGTGFILSLIVRGKAATEATVMEMVEVKLATRDAALIPHQTQDTAVAVGQEGQAPPTPTPAQPTLVLPTATWTGVWTATPAPPTDTPAPPTATWTLPAAAATATRTATRAPSSAATEVATATPSPTATLAASPTAAQATAETATPATVGDQTPVTPEPTAGPGTPPSEATATAVSSPAAAATATPPGAAPAAPTKNRRLLYVVGAGLALLLALALIFGRPKPHHHRQTDR